MYVIVIPRVGNIHVMDYFSITRGIYRTICGKSFYKYDRVNTLGSDDTVDGICSECKNSCDYMYISDLNNDISRARNVFQFGYYKLLTYSKEEVMGPMVDYDYAFSRDWSKLIKYQRLTKRTKKHE